MNCTALSRRRQSAVALCELATKVNRHHEQCVASANDALEHAHAAGDFLLQAKRQCNHGDFGGWLKDNFRGSARTARWYMQISRNWPAIEGKRQRDAVLSIRQAARLVAPPKPSLSTDDNTIPELSPDRILIGLPSEEQDYMVEVHPSAEHPGFYFFQIYRDISSEGAEVVYLGRPCRLDRQLLSRVIRSTVGSLPARWESQPASEKLPWCVEAEKRLARAGI